MVDFLVFVILPYLALVVAIGGTIWRYASNQFTFSSVSSQFLEGRKLFWGSVPWHYGIIAILIGHGIGIVFPSAIKAFNGVPVRLYILEGTGLALGLLVLAGLVFFLVRRGTDPRVRAVTSRMDLVLLIVLLLQVVTGVTIAILYRWGSAWFASTAAPYFWSLATLSPDLAYMTTLPLLVKIHAVNAFVLVGLFPFTRLVHMVAIPFAYLWRPYQVVMWQRRTQRQ
ncbi:MAG: respiratory nitrate reductase subunit gamma [Chloroflexi bacterium]|nr:respiratory nitrate reductase subunit gamma [Chloroflexota bacterium]